MFTLVPAKISQSEMMTHLGAEDFGNGKLAPLRLNIKSKSKSINSKYYRQW